MAKTWGTRNLKLESDSMFWRAVASGKRIYQAPFWTPSTNDILELEQCLWTYLVKISGQLDERTPDCYWRQYAGVTRDPRKKSIYVMGFSSKFGAPDEQLEQDFLAVCDGGAAIWRVFFDQTRKAFSDFRTNGHA